MIDERIRRKLAGMRQAFRGVVTLVNAAGAVQLVQGEGLNGEKLQGMEYFQHFGSTSNPPEGTMYVTIPLGGKTVHCIIVGTEHADHRLKGLLPGESALYNAFSMKIHLTKDGIVVDGGGKDINIQNTPHIIATTAKFTIAGDLEVTGNVTAFSGTAAPISMSAMKLTYNGHKHADPASGSTGIPSGLM
jgi:phage baseplate assembly protein V